MLITGNEDEHINSLMIVHRRAGPMNRCRRAMGFQCHRMFAVEVCNSKSLETVRLRLPKAFGNLVANVDAARGLLPVVQRQRGDALPLVYERRLYSLGVVDAGIVLHDLTFAWRLWGAVHDFEQQRLQFCGSYSERRLLLIHSIVVLSDSLRYSQF